MLFYRSKRDYFGIDREITEKNTALEYMQETLEKLKEVTHKIKCVEDLDQDCPRYIAGLLRMHQKFQSNRIVEGVSDLQEILFFNYQLTRLHTCFQVQAGLHYNLLAELETQVERIKVDASYSKK